MRNPLGRILVCFFKERLVAIFRPFETKCPHIRPEKSKRGSNPRRVAKFGGGERDTAGGGILPAGDFFGGELYSGGLGSQNIKIRRPLPILCAL